MMRNFIIIAVTILLLALPVNAESVYDYELSAGAEDKAEGAVEEFIESIPEEIKKELPENRSSKSIEDYDFDFFVGVAGKALKNGIFPAIGTLSTLLGVVIVGAVFHIFSKSIGNANLEGVFSFCSSICTSLAAFGGIRTLFDTVDSLLSSLSNTVMAVVPAMEAVYIASGNLSTAVVSATGINLMIGFTETLFSKLISPAVYILFILSIVSSVTKNKGMEYMQKTLRGLITGAVVAVMALMTFVLALQTMAGNAQDSVTAKTVKFAIGTYIPIVGGSISEAFSMLSASMGVLKSFCGITAVAALIIAFLTPFSNILLSRIAVGFSGAVAEVLGCERESSLLSECKGICDLLIAVSLSAAVMFIVAIGIFLITGGAVE